MTMKERLFNIIIIHMFLFLKEKFITHCDFNTLCINPESIDSQNASMWNT
jgi:hypothetical protein